jgi:superfamily I DNA/RNA helicase
MSLVRKYVSLADWQSSGIDELEPNALNVVQSANNRCVIAGPGSGKTELLAQRACYLLQCGLSPTPQRILAISYKRDAAYNLAKRVSARCHAEHAHRFDSLTFDAFAKSLVDRFGQALPGAWRPTADYEIAQARDPLIREFLRSLSPPASVGTHADIMAISVKNFEKTFVVAAPLSEQLLANPSPGEWAGRQFWRSWLSGKKSFLTFAMIGRLAELLVRKNPMVRQVLQLTYSHLFMDEFQDTTQVQYDLANTIFLGSKTVVTAVGDNKQQIMRFAMAMEDPFTLYEVDFKAERTPLKNNYRSSPDLVRIQDILARALDPNTPIPVSKSKGAIVGNSCEIWDFKTPVEEAGHLAAFVDSEIKTYKLKPRDLCLLVRMRAAEYMKVMEPAFAARGLQLRNEASSVGEVPLQELLSETVSEILVTVLRLITSERAGNYWTDCMEAICHMRGLALDDERGRAKVAKALEQIAVNFAKAFPAPVGTREGAHAVVAMVLDFVGRQSLLTASPAYRQGDWMEKVIEAAIEHLEASCKIASDWSEALDAYEGTHSVALMTIHKSKGLEYHSVIFVGLDDEAWFAFKNETRNEVCGFFVAFTRAKQRVVFSYCASRGRRDTVAPLYVLLNSAGVQIIAKSQPNSAA